MKLQKLEEVKVKKKLLIQQTKKLIIKKENGRFTQEMLDIYGSYADGYDR